MADCNACKGHTTKPEHVPYLVYESSQARHERTTKRLICVLLIVIFLWACTIGGFMWYLNQYDYSGVDVDVSTDGGGDANYIGQDGRIINGTDPSEIQITPQEERQS